MLVSLVPLPMQGAASLGSTRTLSCRSSMLGGEVPTHTVCGRGVQLAPSRGTSQLVGPDPRLTSPGMRQACLSPFSNDCCLNPTSRHISASTVLWCLLSLLWISTASSPHHCLHLDLRPPLCSFPLASACCTRPVVFALFTTFAAFPSDLRRVFRTVNYTLSPQSRPPPCSPIFHRIQHHVFTLGHSPALDLCTLFAVLVLDMFVC
ncbi:hypothetical protein GGR57DRAFT_218247 [Xylariaceae sp. FL1272]|nr:hypothetical protein GGR57DRAFT_218247 [Xylariaceae sp. FL1272]